MPCYSRITVNIKTLEDVADAAHKLGHSIVTRGNGFIRVRDAQGVEVEFSQYGQGPVTTRRVTGKSAELVSALTVRYAETKIRKFAQAKGFTVSRSPNNRAQLVLTRYR